MLSDEVADFKWMTKDEIIELFRKREVVTRTEKGAVRGLHGEAMSKLITVAYGSVFGAYVDTRPDSETFGAVETVNLRKRYTSGILYKG